MAVIAAALAPSRAGADACCLPDGCLDLAPSSCEYIDGAPQRGAACADVDCTAPQACCDASGACQDSPPAACVHGFGLPGGLGTDCPGVACVVREACCDPWGQCSDVQPDQCLARGDEPRGAGTTCLTATCPRQTMACCTPWGCMDLYPSTCLGEGGEPQFVGSTCASTDCRQACCGIDGQCDDISVDACHAAGGSPRGAGTTCLATSCPISGACCLADGSCLELAASACLAMQGIWRGVGSSCTSPCPRVGWVPDGSSRPGRPLSVRKADPSPWLLLAWGPGCSPDASDYAVFEGDIGAWYSHESSACTTAGAMTFRLEPRRSALGRYFLVAPLLAGAEGSLGLDSFGAERPPAALGACGFSGEPGCR